MINNGGVKDTTLNAREHGMEKVYKIESFSKDFLASKKKIERQREHVLLTHIFPIFPQ